MAPRASGALDLASQLGRRSWRITAAIWFCATGKVAARSSASSSRCAKKWPTEAAGRRTTTTRCRLWKALQGLANEILIVDDEADIPTLITGIMQDEGHETCENGDRAAAMELLRQR